MNKAKIIDTLGPGTQTEEKIVVVTTTDDTMVPNLRSVKGIIAEHPGLTSHAASVGRERGLPVVCNVQGALEMLKNGQMVTIGGTTGHISYGSENYR